MSHSSQDTMANTQDIPQEQPPWLVKLTEKLNGIEDIKKSVDCIPALEHSLNNLNDSLNAVILDRKADLKSIREIKGELKAVPNEDLKLITN